jgi:hypothetical protein
MAICHEIHIISFARMCFLRALRTQAKKTELDQSLLARRSSSEEECNPKKACDTDRALLGKNDFKKL